MLLQKDSIEEGYYSKLKYWSTEVFSLSNKTVGAFFFKLSDENILSEC